jgi:hypothetical protein
LTEKFILELATGGFAEPVGRRSSYTCSRLAILADGTPKPVLLLLAERKFATWDSDRFPFWIDGDRTNEVFSNVGLATRTSTRVGTARGAKRGSARSGTREYMRQWREAHPFQVRAAQLRYNEKRSAPPREERSTLDVPRFSASGVIE